MSRYSVKTIAASPRVRSRRRRRWRSFEVVRRRGFGSRDQHGEPALFAGPVGEARGRERGIRQLVVRRVFLVEERELARSGRRATQQRQPPPQGALGRGRGRERPLAQDRDGEPGAIHIADRFTPDVAAVALQQPLKAEFQPRNSDRCESVPPPAAVADVFARTPEHDGRVVGPHRSEGRYRRKRGPVARERRGRDRDDAASPGRDEGQHGVAFCGRGRAVYFVNDEQVPGVRRQ